MSSRWKKVKCLRFIDFKFKIKLYKIVYKKIRKLSKTKNYFKPCITQNKQKWIFSAIQHHVRLPEKVLKFFVAP